MIINYLSKIIYTRQIYLSKLAAIEANKYPSLVSSLKFLNSILVTKVNKAASATFLVYPFRNLLT